MDKGPETMLLKRRHTKCSKYMKQLGKSKVKCNQVLVIPVKITIMKKKCVSENVKNK